MSVRPPRELHGSSAHRVHHARWFVCVLCLAGCAQQVRPADVADVLDTVASDVFDASTDTVAPDAFDTTDMVREDSFRLDSVSVDTLASTDAPPESEPPLDTARVDAPACVHPSLDCYSTPGCETDGDTDPTNCGSCGHVCAVSFVCLAGACACTVLDRVLTLCGATSADLSHDPLHCGSCATACAATEVCESGSCVDPRWAAWPMPNPASLSPPLPNGARYNTCSSLVVLDLVTHLMWQREVDPTLRSAADAATYCNDLLLAGFDDWRLPTRIEMVTIVDYSVHSFAIDPIVFPGTPGTFAWTATPVGVDTLNGWVVAAGAGGYTGVSRLDALNHVRCVR